MRGRRLVISLVAFVAFDVYVTVLLVRSIQIVGDLEDSDVDPNVAWAGLVTVAIALLLSLAATWWVAARLRARSTNEDG